MSKLKELADLVAAHHPTTEEREAQRKSWAIGEMMLSHPELTREDAEAAYARWLDLQ